MKRKLFFLIVVIVAVTSAHAQWSIKPETGVMVIKGNNNAKWNTRFTMGAGVEYEWKMDGLQLGIQSGLYYTQRGFDKYINKTGYGFTDINRGFIQLPVKMNIYLPLNDRVRFFAGAGPYIAYSINTSWGCQNNYGYKNIPPVRKWDYGVGAHAGVEIRNIIIGVAYDMSFGKELKEQKAGLQYHNFTFSVRYRFKL